jgi:hypothetical protein
MQSIQKSLVLLFFLTLLLATICYAQTKFIKTTIEEITSNPGKYMREKVEIEGVVTQYVDETPTTTGYYLIRGDYGGILTVNYSLRSPKVNARYRVVGVVFIDPANQTPFLSEQERNEIVVDSWFRWLTIIAVLLLVILVFLFFYQARLKKQSLSPSKRIEPEIEEKIESGIPREDLKTIRIITPPKTMKFIPGELVIISGEDKGKAFKIAGYPTPEGNVVTIGREQVTGDRAFAHLQLADSLQTVSRKQAQIIYRNYKIYVKNLSQVNFTQVNGIELGVNEEIELTPGSIIKMGSIELQYKL